MHFLIMSRWNGCCFTFFTILKFLDWNNFEVLLEFSSSGTHTVILTKLWWSQAMLWKFWKIILNTNEVWGVELLFKHKTGNCILDFWFTLLLEKIFKTLDKKLSSLDSYRKANVYWQELNRHHNSCPMEIKSSTIQNCNKNDILKFSM